MAGKLRVLIDLNVILDVLQRREPFYATSARILACAEIGPIEGLVAAHGMTPLFYLIAKDRSSEMARAEINDLFEQEGPAGQLCVRLREMGILVERGRILRPAITSMNLVSFQEGNCSHLSLKRETPCYLSLPDRGHCGRMLSAGCISRRSSMDIEEIKVRVRANEYVYTQHADIERRADELTFAQIEEALLNGEILEQYPDTGRGESCLIVGFAQDVPIHAICGWRGARVAIITVYIPRPPKFVDPWTRGERTDAEI